MGHVDRSEVSSTTPLVSISYAAPFTFRRLLLAQSISCSLGNAAIFLIGGSTRDIKPLPVLLRSGDVVIMSGPRCRRAFHGESLAIFAPRLATESSNGDTLVGVPRILEGTLPVHLQDSSELCWEPFAAYMMTTRININVRQVFPRGYTVPKPGGAALA